MVGNAHGNRAAKAKRCEVGEPEGVSGVPSSPPNDLVCPGGK